MTGEHTHPDLFDVAASLRADLIGMADRLNRLTAQVVTLEAAQAEGFPVTVKYIPPMKKEDRLELDCDGSPHRLDIGAYTPTMSTLLLAEPYVNLTSFTTTSATKPGRLRIFMRRAAFNGQPADDTFFFNLWTHRDGWGDLDSRSMFEWCEKGRPLNWYYEVDGCTAMALDTRFIKYALIS